MSAFLFDLDGTLLDSLEDIGNACNTVLSQNGYPTHSMQDFRMLVGRGFDHLMRNALPAATADSLAPQELARLTDAARAHYSQHMCQCTRPYEGITEALAELATLGEAIAVLSNKPDEMTVSLVRHYFPSVPFALVQGARQGVPLKPSPAAPLDMLRILAVPPDQAFYVGDSDVDIFTARNAGMTSVGVAWGFRGEGELRAAHADHIAKKPQHIVTLAQNRLCLPPQNA
ncbi:MULTISPECIES: HAD family hydrolase [unclassified Desulfovibrio]|uniref:HAD family hydrolase n=1 Tax=unclassified Desulfovibrio TaxID=2593640 RepID=UPI000F5D5A58|nr:MULTISPECIES: HAD family hydrolase [unclassified Desulfovibrio]RRD71029.1 HAD family hydrolase [Desulfovibrio sp. OH1209_COT-279]RRD87371.1 HAD family hydrolase [Desulfovibrio sp. OH1186_COT-070]